MAFYGKNNSWWQALLTGDNPILPFRQFRHLFGILPSNARCKFCHAPFEGAGKRLMRLIGKSPSRLTPQLCMQCEAFARNIPGGAEIELSMLFADVRGSTALAEKMSPYEYSQLINTFYVTATEILVKTHGWVDRLVGDQVIGLFIPGFSGPDHARLAVQAALELIQRMGHDDPDGPLLPVGAGVHTDVAFVGAVGTEGGATDITVLGDAANTTARLSSLAGTGEVLVSDSAITSMRVDLQGLEKRHLQLKGKSQPMDAFVLRTSDIGTISSSD
jgi:adenylate cyclase